MRRTISCRVTVRWHSREYEPRRHLGQPPYLAEGELAAGLEYLQYELVIACSAHSAHAGQRDADAGGAAPQAPQTIQVLGNRGLDSSEGTFP